MSSELRRPYARLHKIALPKTNNIKRKMSSAAKKKTGAKDRGGTEGTATVATVQSVFTSAARATMWHADSVAASTAAAAAGDGGGNSVSRLNTFDSPRAYTAAANVVSGRPFGAAQLESPWLHTETVTRVRDKDRLLPASSTWETERAVYARLFTPLPAMPSNALASSLIHSATSEDNGDESASTPPHITDLMYEEWLQHVATHRGTPLLYPHHTLLFDATPMSAPPSLIPAVSSLPSSSSACMQIASVLHGLLAAYLQRCSEQPCGYDVNAADKEVPLRVFANLLYTSVYNNYFSSPAEEQKDVAFGAGGAAKVGATASVGAADTVSFSCPRRYDAMSVISCLGASHVCVCVGLDFYKLSVVDEQLGRLRSVTAMASGLEAVLRHHSELQQTDLLAEASPAVQRDRDAIIAMLASLSSLNDQDAFDVRRRLREASGVNAYTLDMLQSGLCTLELKGVDGDDRDGRPQARWLHSVCSLGVSLREPTQWQMRLLAAVVPPQAGVEWIARAATRAAAAGSTATSAEGTSATTAAAAASMPPAWPKLSDDEKPADAAVGAQQAIAAVRAARQASVSTPIDDDGQAEYLELWLPEKHRVPLRPYPEPQWDPETTQMPMEGVSLFSSSSVGACCTVEQFVVTLLRLLIELQPRNTSLRKSATFGAGVSGGEWPRVVLAVQPINGGAPSLVALDSPAIQHYYEVLAARPLLFAKATRQRIEAEATAEVRAVLNIAWHAAVAVRTQPPKTGEEAKPSSSWWDALEASPADVCVSFAVLPRTTATMLPPTPVRRVVSNLALSSSLLVNCTAQQTAAEAHLRASAARVMDAVVQANTEASLEFCRAFSHAFA